MNIQEGFKIDEPGIFIPWGIDEHMLTQKLNGHGYNHVTTGYYTISCKSLNGLNCMLGFHFEPRKDGFLNELEFFRTDYSDPGKSFTEFQSYFEAEFGKPTLEANGNEGFKNYAWNLDTVQIVHYVFDRFGPEEHMRIKKINKSESTTTAKSKRADSIKRNDNIVTNLWSRLIGK
ncbi:hypothetical protein GCM10011375_40980 [Hymenobacter qilianensis]|uniref:Uncharacterized protein n=2 Tax=Hymenobacter qilianensis TaxID=1385715 RepID=A0ACB5PXI4_9BACT|nr:hypothetical protein [Hymenobacter qilianensis]QNP54548.1 hypothetical protein H9L05_22635 [Hymenobacter qilianensis]GGF81839.1 hypothetical protein GCM10011375_40980 [Hymenobacter qilianensis]